MADEVSHDQNFKNLILDYPRDALAFFGGDEAPLEQDDARIIPIRQEQLQERLGERFRELDTPLLVEWAEGRREAVLFVLEEESDSRRFNLRRLAHYCLDLADMFDTDRVVPVAIFLRDANAAPLALVLGTERRTYLTFDYLSCKIAEMSAERWWDSDNLVARVNLPNMNIPEDGKVEVYAQAVRGVLALEQDSDLREKYIDFIDIYAGLTENERSRYRRQYPEEGATMAGMFQRARDEGMQQGRVEGERAVLERLLQRRFGLLSPEITRRLNEASAGELETLADRVLDAGTLDDVFDSDS
ncbi:MAG: DUF4351 domain-containing protein [Gammaproteobacteria bacterium]|nr:DUF4351 domain-containing protein [Gammaproteobacteria bacterium]MDE0223983.1 DUF4351 domain-containing protein [Gammaproteobacteria bacterium]